MALIIFFAAVAALTVFVSMKKSGHFLKSFFVSTAQGIASLFAVNALCGLTGNNEFDSADYNDKIKYLLIYD